MNTRYINTDLELVAPFDLTELTAALEAQELFSFYTTQQKDGSWAASFEFCTFEGDDKYANPESAIVGMLHIVESLEGEALAHWKGCRVRNFNVGYACGLEPFAFFHKLANATLLRMANAGTDMEITLYGMRGQQDDAQ